MSETLNRISADFDQTQVNESKTITKDVSKQVEKPSSLKSIVLQAGTVKEFFAMLEKEWNDSVKKNRGE